MNYEKIADVVPVNPDLFRVGDYVLATKFGDADPFDRWAVDYIREFIDMKTHYRVLMRSTGQLSYSFAKKLSQEEGEAILAFYSTMPNIGFKRNN